METSGGRIDQLGEGVHVGALQLGELAVLENFAHDFVIGREVFEHVGGGGDGLALAVFDGRGQLEIFEEHLTQLLR